MVLKRKLDPAFSDRLSLPLHLSASYELWPNKHVTNSQVLLDVGGRRSAGE